MKVLSADRGDYATSQAIHELASVADKALVTGDYHRVVAIVENIYELLDWQSEFATQDDAPVQPGATRC